jgi:hypothetical protein
MMVAETYITVTLLFKEWLQMNIQPTCAHRYVTAAAAALCVGTLIHLVAVIP